MRSQNEVSYLGVGVVADGQQRAAHLDALLLVLGLAPRLEKCEAMRALQKFPEPSVLLRNISETLQHLMQCLSSP
jgi:hypothetical protein